MNIFFQEMKFEKIFEGWNLVLWRANQGNIQQRPILSEFQEPQWELPIPTPANENSTLEVLIKRLEASFQERQKSVDASIQIMHEDLKSKIDSLWRKFEYLS